MVLPAGLHRRGQTFPDIVIIVYRRRGGRSARWNVMKSAIIQALSAGD
jgi:hypothetical protein